MVRSTDITGFDDHRAHLRDHLQQVQETGRPLFITTEGRTAAVLLSPDAYDELAEKAELAQSLALIDRNLEHLAEGSTDLAQPALERIARELGLKIDH